MSETIQEAEKKVPQTLADFIPEEQDGGVPFGDFFRGFKDFMAARLEFAEAVAVNAEIPNLKAGAGFSYVNAIVKLDERYANSDEFAALAEAAESGLPVIDKRSVSYIVEARKKLQELDTCDMSIKERYDAAAAVFQDLGTEFRTRAGNNILMQQVSAALSETPSDILAFFEKHPEQASVVMNNMKMLVDRQKEQVSAALPEDGVFSHSQKFVDFGKQNMQKMNETMNSMGR